MRPFRCILLAVGCLLLPRLGSAQVVPLDPAGGSILAPATTDPPAPPAAAFVISQPTLSMTWLVSLGTRFFFNTIPGQLSPMVSDIRIARALRRPSPVAGRRK